MKRISLILTAFALCVAVLSGAEAQTDTVMPTKKIKKGWNFGALPSVAYDADLGFQYGALANVYYYGDGSIYPEYMHSFYVEAAYTTKNYGIFRFFYDSKYLIPNHRFTFDASYLPDAMCDFSGFNGYMSVFNNGWRNKKDDAYVSRAFYKYRRDLFRTAADIEGDITGHWKWNAGLGVLGYMLGPVNIDMLNRGKKKEANKLPDIDGLYDRYVDWGLIKQNEKSGGWHPYLRGGITYDSRDFRANPTRGIYADAFLTYSAAFGEQTEYNNLKFNVNFRHYVSLYRDYAVLAYRVGAQTLLAGRSPFYMNTYQNTLFLQRVLYEALGGGNSLRGVVRNRVLANGFAYANVEFRFKLVKFDIGRQHFYVGVNPFFDLGMVTQPYALDEGKIRQAMATHHPEDRPEDFFNFDQRSAYLPHMSAGIGLKAAMNENFILSVDWAAPFNKQDATGYSNFYIKMGYLF